MGDCAHSTRVLFLESNCFRTVYAFGKYCDGSHLAAGSELHSVLLDTVRIVSRFLFSGAVAAGSLDQPDTSGYTYTLRNTRILTTSTVPRTPLKSQSKIVIQAKTVDLSSANPSPTTISRLAGSLLKLRPGQCISYVSTKSYFPLSPLLSTYVLQAPIF